MSAMVLTQGRVPNLASLYHEVIDHRDLLWLLVVKQLKVKYKGTALGLVWSLLNPLLMMTVYALVFTVIARFTMSRYPVFLLSGLLPWTAFATTLSDGASSILRNGNLMRRVRMPVQLFPVTEVLANLLNLLPSFAVLVLFAAIYHQQLGLPLIALPLLLVLQALFTAGLTLALAGLMVYFRDVQHFVGVVLMAWFFATPIIYPLSAFDGRSMHRLLKLNPMTWLMDGYQRIWYANAWPDLRFTLAFAVAGLLTLVMGSLIFNRLRLRFAEEV